MKNSENVIEAKVETVNSSPLPNNFAELLASKSTQETNVIEKRTSELRNAYIQMQTITKEKNLKDEIDYILAAAYSAFIPTPDKIARPVLYIASSLPNSAACL